MNQLIGNLKPGFLFAGESETTTDTPDAYRTVFNGGLGVIYRVDPNHPNGGEPITFKKYSEVEVPLF